ncbi:MAG TPA: protein-L-isoaspartate(D-aspartate) O-methyltransferase [Burkholderiaceae bacterium]|nr:protein-L-isoaspartate(D-aspartate) O-methyltransferase [Burkholderiaceae bacterium]
MNPNDLAKLRIDMVAQQIAARGVRCPLVLEAMRAVPRERFVPEPLRDHAFDDAPLPIAEGQTISEPYIVALMIEALALQGGETVLEVGTGSGYAAAVLSRIAGQVYTIERIAGLADAAAARLAALGHANVQVLTGDGTVGWPAGAPFDAIVVTATGPVVPPALKAQLGIGGRLVMPVGRRRGFQELLQVTRVSEQEFRTESLAAVRFVPLLGEQGWAP